jgi:GNAT superfamily N-acetyltransferase
MSRPIVRPAVGDDLPILRQIEWASGQRFREYGLDHVADDEPVSVEVLSRYASQGRAWVAVDHADQPIGFVVVDMVDGLGHIEQVSVAPDWQGQGLGRALIEQAKAWAVSRDVPALTLTTFEHIPWNRPLYEHLGFRVLSPDQITPGVQARRDAETEHGLDPELRVVMRLDLQNRESGAERGVDRSGS